MISANDLDEFIPVANANHPKPLVVFIPGILGSKLTDMKTGEVVWGGNNFNHPKLLYDETIDLKPEILSDVEIRALLRKWKFGVYGEAIKKIKREWFGGGKLLKTFPYDWRQSNKKSAAKLQTWFCDNKSELADKSVIFLAHSMGGLVLKAWFRYHYDQKDRCANSESPANWLNIGNISFIGTPHYGAPKTLEAIIKEYRLLGFVKPLDRYVSKGLNNYGASFPSFYQLLPIQSTLSNCIDLSLHGLVPALRISGRPDILIELFDADTWDKMNIPAQIPKTMEKNFYISHLPNFLRDARNLLCDLANYDVPSALKNRRMYFFGRTEKADTVRSYSIELREDQPPKIVNKQIEPSRGDGTVPVEIARWRFKRNVHETRPLSKSHMFLMEDINLVDFVGDLLYADQVYRASRTAEKVGLKSIAKTLAENNKLLKVRPVTATISKYYPAGASFADDLKLITNVNRAAVSAANIDIERIYSFARMETDNEKRADFYNLFVDISDKNGFKQAWAANNAGDIYRSEGRYSKAKVSLDRAIMIGSQALVSADLDQKKRASIEDALSKAYNNSALVELWNGDAVAAESRSVKAFKFGNLKAEKNLDRFEGMVAEYSGSSTWILN